jgi:twitching motility protein PilT
MLIDSFIKHLTTLNAESLEVVSGSAVRFRLKDSEKQSQGIFNHSQLQQLIKEVASDAAIDELYRTRRLSCQTADNSYQLEVEMLDLDLWRLEVSRVKVAAATPAPQPAPSAAVQEAAPTSEALSPTPAVYGPVGEPRINSYLRMMVDKGASDLHMSSNTPIMARLHGEIAPIAGDTAMSSSDLLNLLMEIIPEETRIEFQSTSDADFAHTIPGVARFRANYFMDRHGIGAVFRQIPFDILTPEQLGLPQEVLDLCWLSKGLVLVTGPTGSGKSTTLASLIDYINRNRSDHIITIEDPIEFVHSNKKCLVNQREIGTHTQSFKRALRAALREDPDIVLVGELRDLETIAIAVETAETGHLVFGTLHTSTAPSTVDRIIDQFSPEQQAQIRVMLSESLKGVISQVLCKKEGGGRAAAYEILLANTAISNLIREGKTFQLGSLMQTGKAQGMRTMNDSLLALVKDGKVAPQEAYTKAVDKQGLKLLFAQAGIKLELNNEKAKIV